MYLRNIERSIDIIWISSVTRIFITWDNTFKSQSPLPSITALYNNKLTFTSYIVGVRRAIAVERMFATITQLLLTDVEMIIGFWPLWPIIDVLVSRGSQFVSANWTLTFVSGGIRRLILDLLEKMKGGVQQLTSGMPIFSSGIFTGKYEVNQQISPRSQNFCSN